MPCEGYEYLINLQLAVVVQKYLINFLYLVRILIVQFLVFLHI